MKIDYLAMLSGQIMRTEIDIAIIENVKKMRQKLDISQKVLADIINVSPAFIGQVEVDKYVTKYSAHQIYLIAKFFECEVSDLYPPINRLEP